jgi:uncharacterized membrane protein required for colicin V production
MNWVDWTIIAIIALMALSGLRRGLIKTVVGFAAQIGALIAAFVLTKPVSLWLELRFNAASRLADFLARYIQLPPDFAKTTVTNLSSGQLWAMLDSSGLPEQYKDAVMTWVADSPAGVSVTLSRFIQESLGMLLLNVLTFIALLTVSRIAIGLVGRAFSGTVHAVGAGALDHLGGLGLGAAQGVIVCALILGLGLPMLSMDSMSNIAGAVRVSRFAPPLLDAFYQITPWLRQAGQAIWERPR